MSISLSDEQRLVLIRDHTQQLKNDPASPCFLQLAQCYNELELIDAAINAVNSGLIHHPDNIHGQILLAQLLCQNGQFDDSAVAFDTVLRQNPDRVDALIGMARLSLLQEHRQRAGEFFARAQAIDSDNPLVSDFAAEIGTMGAIDVDTDNEESLPLATATVAELYVQQGLQEKAVSVYKNLLEQQPGNAQFKIRLQELLGATEAADEVPASLKDRLECWLDAIDRRRKHV